MSPPILSVMADTVRELEEGEALAGLWTLFTKCKESLKDRRRLENMSCRLWYHELMLAGPPSEKKKHPVERDGDGDHCPLTLTLDVDERALLDEPCSVRYNLSILPLLPLSEPTMTREAVISAAESLPMPAVVDVAGGYVSSGTVAESGGSIPSTATAQGPPSPPSSTTSPMPSSTSAIPSLPQFHHYQCQPKYRYKPQPHAHHHHHACSCAFKCGGEGSWAVSYFAWMSWDTLSCEICVEARTNVDEPKDNVEACIRKGEDMVEPHDKDADSNSKPYHHHQKCNSTSLMSSRASSAMSVLTGSRVYFALCFTFASRAFTPVTQIHINECTFPVTQALSAHSHLRSSTTSTTTITTTATTACAHAHALQPAPPNAITRRASSGGTSQSQSRPLLSVSGTST
ncbi:uncharacterized protein LACBIDRAFT_323964 [Laccaria bicolor S238N-H82]|uniref:Predicted protein n=1 Tax=Laccaria bicolor (strain S238N-H82 / ATCC MYA-4686) TaxID=486041 RepID=B0D070_LACBS|nr:uncharacterized protein LACBIDRAFT_323964 [Laccaria bicolor S238N-H82]EDR11403.1 predicted protein [Laccaria bicolor S238N-H82]|eukprot:XP_001877300.1 predicted protein [Laccaria bicolor S238N-H82]